MNRIEINVVTGERKNIELTLEEVAALQSRVISPDEFNAPIKAQIAALDQKCVRPLAELAGKPYDPTSSDAIHLAQLNEQIAALRAQLK